MIKIVLGLLIYTAVMYWSKKRGEKQEERQYLEELSRNWERNPRIYSH